ncbi:hypothetical protein LfeInf_054 [Lactobacillus phage LfeInf]|uniref:Uncharacterized protein n=1 Tax=Lactobacillus phage LfeInf TaxID=1567484 RepID=A0A0A7NNP9_9CAUD|nr:hypothetical protein AXJ15_gp108 [Lactobacillus phage LfeInf]AIZ94680.1 hypothetical protein LfeInf_054 [Lactobacillus phage LfeInf]
MTPDERSEKIKELMGLLSRSKQQLQELQDSMFSEARHKLDYDSKQLLYSMTGNIDNFVRSTWSPGYVSVDDYSKITGKDFVGETVDGVTYPQSASVSQPQSASQSDPAPASTSTSASDSSPASASTADSQSSSTTASASASQIEPAPASTSASEPESSSTSATQSEPVSASTSVSEPASSVDK